VLRLIFGWPMQIGDVTIPLWVSWIGLIVAGALAYFGLRLTVRQ
jgi:type VI protein secretion system component VasF